MLNEQMRLIRKFNGFTQQQIADTLKIDRSTYASYEIGRNRPDIAVLQNFARIFNVSVDYILHLDENTVYRLRDETNDYEKEMLKYSLLSKLTPDEKALIAAYRLCDPKTQKAILTKVNCGVKTEK